MKPRFLTLKEECRKEAYNYFDKNIRKLPKTSSGEYDVSPEEFYDNDVDAFRHAYTSGVYVQEYNEWFSEKMGQAQEIFGDNTKTSQNMDYWNNAVGRKYGIQNKDKTRQDLADNLKKALEKDELIITPTDPRKYDSASIDQIDLNKPILVLQESETGRNEWFLDQLSGNIMDRESFVNQIQSGAYPGYQIAIIDTIPTPISKPDGVTSNNLG